MVLRLRKFLKLLRAQDGVATRWSHHEARRSADYSNPFLGGFLLEFFEQFFLLVLHFLLNGMLAGPVAFRFKSRWNCGISDCRASCAHPLAKQSRDRREGAAHAVFRGCQNC